MVKEDEGKALYIKSLGNNILGDSIILFGGFFSYIMDNNLLKLVTLGITIDQAARTYRRGDNLLYEFQRKKTKKLK